MNPMEFVKKDLAKLAGNKKLFKTLAMVGGIGLTVLNMVNDKNDREAMKADITEEVLKNLTKKDQ